MTEIPQRLSPKAETIKLLLLRSGNQCAFPGCSRHIFNDINELVGECCHIEAALPDGERFNPQQTNEERRSYNNLIFLCHEHHIQTNNILIYTVSALQKIKNDHEVKFKERPVTLNPTYVDQVIATFEDIKADIKENIEISKRIVETQNKIITFANSTFNQSFFNRFDIHKYVVENLNSQISNEMRETADLLAKKCNQNYGDATNFFELLYRILHLKYKCHSDVRDFRKVKEFFYNYDWRIKNYVMSFISLIKWIQTNNISRDNIKSYIDILHTSTMDEIRLIFYYIISREDPEKKELVSLFDEYKFFEIIKSPSLPLIYEEDWQEYNQNL